MTIVSVILAAVDHLQPLLLSFLSLPVFIDSMPSVSVHLLKCLQMLTSFLLEIQQGFVVVYVGGSQRPGGTSSK